VQQTPADQDQGLAVEEEVTTNHMAAAEAKVEAPLAMAEVLIVEVAAAMGAGTVGPEVDKEVDRMAEDSHTEVEANRVVVAMVSNNNTKVNKVAILDSFTLACGVERRKRQDELSFRDTQFGVSLFVCLVVASSCQEGSKHGSSNI